MLLVHENITRHLAVTSLTMYSHFNDIPRKVNTGKIFISFDYNDLKGFAVSHNFLLQFVKVAI